MTSPHVAFIAKFKALRPWLQPRKAQPVPDQRAKRSPISTISLIYRLRPALLLKDRRINVQIRYVRLYFLMNDSLRPDLW